MPPSLGGIVRGPRGAGAGGRSASVRPSASLGRAPKGASLASLCPWRPWSPYCPGSCSCASALMRSAVCQCAPAQDCRPVEVTVARRMGLVALVPGYRGPPGGGGSHCPSKGGTRPTSSWPVSCILRAGWGGGGRGGGSRRGSPLHPLVHFPGSRGGWPEGPASDPPTAGSVALCALRCKVLGHGCLASLGAGRGPGG